MTRDDPLLDCKLQAEFVIDGRVAIWNNVLSRQIALSNRVSISWRLANLWFLKYALVRNFAMKFCILCDMTNAEVTGQRLKTELAKKQVV